METLTLLFIGLGLWFYVNRNSAISDLQRRVEHLEKKFQSLHSQRQAGKAMPGNLELAEFEKNEPEQPAAQKTGAKYGGSVPPHSEINWSTPYTTRDTQGVDKTNPSSVVPDSDTASGSKDLSLEQIISTRLGVWVGAIALILGAVFLIKYSIDEGLLSPAVRVILSGLFGLSLIGGAEIMRRKEEVPNAFRIAQGLCGAGFAIAYGALYAATSLYHLLPDFLGFIGLAVVTAGTIISALRYGLPIATLGLLGGFVTPLLVHSDTPDGLSLFGYLFALSFMGLMIAQRKGWWLLALITLIGAVLWTAFWIAAVGTFSSLVLVFFGMPLVLMTAFFTTFMEQKVGEQESFQPSPLMLNGLAFAAFTLLLFFIPSSSFDTYAWAMTFAMAISVVILARLRPATFTKLLIPMQIASMLMVWRGLGIATDVEHEGAAILQTLLLLGGFTVLYGTSGYTGLISSPAKRMHAWLTSSTLVFAYGIAHVKLKGLIPVSQFAHHYFPQAGADLSALPVHQPLFSDNMIWGLVALLFSAALTILAQRQETSISNKDEHNHVLAALATGASALLSLSIVHILPVEGWAVGFALQVFATLWIYSRTGVPALPFFSTALSVLIILENISWTIGGIWHLTFFGNLSVIDAATLVFGYLVPAGILFATHRMLNNGENGVISRLVFYTASLLTILGAAYLVNTLWAHESFLKHTFYTLLLLGAAAIGLKNPIAYGYKDIMRPVAYTLLAIGGFRLGAHQLLLANPLFSTQYVGSLPIFNAAALGYIAPIIPLHFCAREIGLYKKWHMAIKSFFTFLFIFGAGLVIRQMFQGEVLALGTATAGMAEQISYSALGVLTGLGLLTLAMRLKDTAWRWLSLIVIILTVGKVFLVDASHLDGLARVFSFIGLGLSLFALSGFYSRYVFKKMGQ